MPTIYICTGKDCRKRKNAGKLKSLLKAESVSYQEVRCQKICKGPVVGLVVDKRVEWFSRVRGRKGRRLLLRFHNDGNIHSLWKYRNKKRSGKLR